jgi:hypothetical protein
MSFLYRSDWNTILRYVYVTASTQATPMPAGLSH